MKKFSLGQGRPCGPFNTSSTCRVKQFSVTAQPALQARHCPCTPNVKINEMRKGRKGKDSVNLSSNKAPIIMMIHPTKKIQSLSVQSWKFLSEKESTPTRPHQIRWFLRT